MKTGYDRAFDVLVDAEGFESCDSGGDTILGITKRWWPEDYAAVKAAFAVSRNAALAAAKKFYQREFWDKLHCWEYDEVSAILILLFAINRPPGKAAMRMHDAMKLFDSAHTAGTMLTDADMVKFANMSKRSPEAMAAALITMMGIDYIRIITANPNNQQYARSWFRRMGLLTRRAAL